MHVTTTRFFGSSARGDADSHSDIDLLLVSNTRSPTRQQLQRLLGDSHARVDCSVYSPTRLQEMHRAGHLFSWHLWLESKPGPLAGDLPLFIEQMGPPASPRSTLEGARFLAEDLAATAQAMSSGSRSVIFDAGIAYICARNIAIYLSWHTAEGLTFSRNAPFVLAKRTGVAFPATAAAYMSLYQCRRAARMPEVVSLLPDKQTLIDVVKPLPDWAERTIQIVEGGE